MCTAVTDRLAPRTKFDSDSGSLESTLEPMAHLTDTSAAALVNPGKRPDTQ
jgi:hypothetical protein